MRRPQPVVVGSWPVQGFLDVSDQNSQSCSFKFYRIEIVHVMTQSREYLLHVCGSKEREEYFKPYSSDNLEKVFDRFVSTVTFEKCTRHETPDWTGQRVRKISLSGIKEPKVLHDVLRQYFKGWKLGSLAEFNPPSENNNGDIAQSNASVRRSASPPTTLRAHVDAAKSYQSKRSKRGQEMVQRAAAESPSNGKRKSSPSPLKDKKQSVLPFSFSPTTTRVKKPRKELHSDDEIEEDSDCMVFETDTKSRNSRKRRKGRQVDSDLDDSDDSAEAMCSPRVSVNRKQKEELSIRDLSKRRSSPFSSLPCISPSHSSPRPPSSKPSSFLGNMVKKVKTGISSITKRFTSSNKKSDNVKINGFRNVGNSCYVNAVLQSLLSLRPFVHDLWELVESDGGELGGGSSSPSSSTSVTISPSSSFKRVRQVGLSQRQASFFRSLAQVAREKEDSNHGVIDVKHLKDVIAKRYPRFSGNAQQDAHEFFSQCLNQLNDEVVREAKLLARERPKANGVDMSRVGGDHFSKGCNGKRSEKGDASNDVLCLLSEDSGDERVSPRKVPATEIEMDNFFGLNIEAEEEEEEGREERDEEEEGNGGEGAKASDKQKERKEEQERAADAAIDALMNSPTVTNFLCVVETTLRCSECGHERKIKEPHYDFSLDWPEDEEEEEEKEEKKKEMEKEKAEKENVFSTGDKDGDSKIEGANDIVARLLVRRSGVSGGAYFLGRGSSRYLSMFWASLSLPLFYFFIFFAKCHTLIVLLSFAFSFQLLTSVR